MGAHLTPNVEPKSIAELVEIISIPDEYQRDFYIFVAIMTEWLEARGISYFMHSGTALGAVRHRGFIPWDDDFDVMVEEKYESALIEGLKDLETYGVQLNEKHASNGHYQFYFKNPRVVSTTKRYYCFDIFIGRHEEVAGESVLHYKHPDFRRWFHDRYIAVKDVYPLRKVNFGPLLLWAMHDETDYFRRSNFKVDEATLRIHMIDQQWLDRQIERFKKDGTYPIKDAEILRRKSDASFVYEGLASYKIL